MEIANGIKKCFEINDASIVKFQAIPNELKGGNVELFFGEIMRTKVLLFDNR